MTAIPKDFGYGGAGLVPGSAIPDLVTTLREIADDFAANHAVPAWSGSQAVSSHTVTLTGAGWVFAVDATTGTTPGPKQIVSSGTPATGQVKVTYAAGVATLTFAAGDAITACVVQKLPYATIKTTKQ